MNANSNILRCGAAIFAGGFLIASAFSETTAAGSNATVAPTPASGMEGKENKLTPKAHHAWFGALAKDSQLPAGSKHQSAPDVRITSVAPNSPASRAGLQPGDVIWKYDGTRLKSTAQLKSELQREKAGTVVPIEIFRNGRREDLKVKLGVIG